MSNAGYSMLGAGARGWPRGMLWGGRWEGGSCWDRMYTRGGFMSMYVETNKKKNFFFIYKKNFIQKNKKINETEEKRKMN